MYPPERYGCELFHTEGKERQLLHFLGYRAFKVPSAKIAFAPIFAYKYALAVELNVREQPLLQFSYSETREQAPLNESGYVVC